MQERLLQKDGRNQESENLQVVASILKNKLVESVREWTVSDEIGYSYRIQMNKSLNKEDSQVKELQ